MLLGTEQQCLPTLQERFAVQQYHSAAGIAPDTDICPGTENGPFVSAAGMGLAGANHITGKNQFNHSTSPINQQDPDSGMPAESIIP